MSASATTRVAIIAALPGELKPLVKGWTYSRQGTLHLWQQTSGSITALAACAGMGADPATRAFAAIEREGSIDHVLSYGWIGALTPDTPAGKATWPAGVIDARTGERFPSSADQTAGWQVTIPQVADTEEKQKLATRYNASFVDMEAATIARLAAMRDLPFALCRGISDGAHDVLPDFNRFRTRTGQFQMAKFVAYAAFHPQYWRPLAKMGENSRRAATEMATELQQFLKACAQTPK